MFARESLTVPKGLTMQQQQQQQQPVPMALKEKQTPSWHLCSAFVGLLPWGDNDVYAWARRDCIGFMGIRGRRRQRGKKAALAEETATGQETLAAAATAPPEQDQGKHTAPESRHSNELEMVVALRRLHNVVLVAGCHKLQRILYVEWYPDEIPSAAEPETPVESEGSDNAPTPDVGSSDSDGLMLPPGYGILSCYWCATGYVSHLVRLDRMFPKAMAITKEGDVLLASSPQQRSGDGTQEQPSWTVHALLHDALEYAVPGSDQPPDIRLHPLIRGRVATPRRNTSRSAPEPDEDIQQRNTQKKRRRKAGRRGEGDKQPRDTGRDYELALNGPTSVDCMHVLPDGTLMVGVSYCVPPESSVSMSSNGRSSLVVRPVVPRAGGNTSGGKDSEPDAEPVGAGCLWMVPRVRALTSQELSLPRFAWYSAQVVYDNLPKLRAVACRWNHRERLVEAFIATTMPAARTATGMGARGERAKQTSAAAITTTIATMGLAFCSDVATAIEESANPLLQGRPVTILQEDMLSVAVGKSGNVLASPLMSQIAGKVCDTSKIRALWREGCAQWDRVLANPLEELQWMAHEQTPQGLNRKTCGVGGAPLPTPEELEEEEAMRQAAETGATGGAPGLETGTGGGGTEDGVRAGAGADDADDGDNGDTESGQSVESSIHEYQRPANVRVVVRCRPLLPTEVNEGRKVVVSTRESSGKLFLDGNHLASQVPRTFTFDSVLGPSTTQEDVYANVCEPVMPRVLQGTRCTILAYGQTGSGKTHTMEGMWAEQSTGSGIIPRAIHHLFRLLKEDKTLLSHSVKVSHMEIYNEEVYDLLASDPTEQLISLSRSTTPRPGSVGRSSSNGSNSDDEEEEAIRAAAAATAAAAKVASHVLNASSMSFDRMMPDNPMLYGTQRGPKTGGTGVPAPPAPVSRGSSAPSSAKLLMRKGSGGSLGGGSVGSGGSGGGGGGKQSAPPPLRREVQSVQWTPGDFVPFTTVEQDQEKPRPTSPVPSIRVPGSSSGASGGFVTAGGAAAAAGGAAAAAGGAAAAAGVAAAAGGTRKGVTARAQSISSTGTTPRGTPRSTPRGSPRTTPRGDYIPLGLRKSLRIETHQSHGIMIRGLTCVQVFNPDEIFSVLSRTTSSRRTAETLCNRTSSRSHALFSVSVNTSARDPKTGKVVDREGRLNLVDLSGSECIKKSGATGARQREAANIARSLLALGRVLRALVQGTSHIPYRASKLTRILSDSIGGNSFTTMILNVTPAHHMIEETLSTLNYATLAQHVQNHPVVTRRVRRTQQLGLPETDSAEAQAEAPAEAGGQRAERPEVDEAEAEAREQQGAAGSHHSSPTQQQPQQQAVPMRRPTTASSKAAARRRLPGVEYSKQTRRKQHKSSVRGRIPPSRRSPIARQGDKQDQAANGGGDDERGVLVDAAEDLWDQDYDSDTLAWISTNLFDTRSPTDAVALHSQLEADVRRRFSEHELCEVMQRLVVSDPTAALAASVGNSVDRPQSAPTSRSSRHRRPSLGHSRASAAAEELRQLTGPACAKLRNGTRAALQHVFHVLSDGSKAATPTTGGRLGGRAVYSLLRLFGELSHAEIEQLRSHNRKRTETSSSASALSPDPARRHRARRGLPPKQSRSAASTPVLGLTNKAGTASHVAGGGGGEDAADGLLRALSVPELGRPGSCAALPGAKPSSSPKIRLSPAPRWAEDAMGYVCFNDFLAFIVAMSAVNPIGLRRMLHRCGISMNFNVIAADK